MTREEKIISIVSKSKKITVNALAQYLGVSKVTIRKDLDKLETRGIIHRQHGFALLNSQDDMNYHLAQNYELKRKIAQTAASLVKDGDSVMIESGATCTLLAEELAYHKDEVTIITNSCFIAAYIRKAKNVNIILLGGEYQKESQVNVGPLVKKYVDEFYVDKLFVGIDGFDEKRGFTSNNLARCDASKALVQAARETIILTDSTKFNQTGIISGFSFGEITKLYTDKKINETTAKFIKSKGIELVLC
ncbi:DeoR/GlpR family DNA-binding transcription regulator [Melissococcus plutonius]|uniref:Lactose phosphotransferase system repressor n=2 Tax=Melissococcus plutonius TaxID=33970 RepID=F3Y871_MELPT|nr:DeoR/GlpR family DNA-binding transcription regulator [Melissococcus plutonius]BAL61493.1 DeoR family transcriptional regulator [Melissococcus plutonius DAT561]AIM25495.1 DeoR family transcriptional regulator [Melissococcus plutonius S1]KMT25838.1 DeoR family transcriptional regulator [Melissococcus plutonius]KMT27183.1 DeoR family transcriptional regulator [Melissococcus plutonius]KMT28284.1 DeoR family transcriptional regulator [Melissococcus plutonius]